MKYLVIAEKPSLMRSIQECYQNHRAEIEQKIGTLEFHALVGHACRNAMPNEYPQWQDISWERLDYPIIPQSWITKPREDRSQGKMLRDLKAKLDHCDAIICATDSDAEGYGIYYLVCDFLKLRNMPTLRFIEHSLTDKEILHSLLTMTDLYQDPVHRCFMGSYMIRSRADWLYGLNLTMLMSTITGTKKTVGRVKAPTIKLVYDRCNEIDHFVKKAYYEVAADYDGFKGKLVDEKGKAIQYEKKADIPNDIPLSGVVTSIEQKKAVTACQQLYDLAALQLDAGRAYGLSPQKTLDIAQSLYEKHKVLSYPRTQCRYVSSERAKEFRDILPALCAFPEIENVKGQMDIKRASNKRVVNDVEVQKEAHDALLPTGVAKKPEELSADERKVYWLVCRRLAEQFLPAAEDLKTMAFIMHPDKSGYRFKADGAVIVERGWRVLYKERTVNALPALKEGSSLTAKSIDPVECETRPPRRFTQASLAAAMENIASLIKDDKEAKASLAESKGIGKASTRAKIISEIIQYGYVAEKKDGLYITAAGREYVDSLDGIGITDPMFAADMDMKIKKVQRGEAAYKEVYQDVLDGLDIAVKNAMNLNKGKKFGSTGVHCPKCGGEFTTGQWQYSCSCGFTVRKEICGHAITVEDLRTLLKGREIGPYAMKSKAGKKFRSKLILNLEDGKILFPQFEEQELSICCPVCGKKLTARRWNYTCECGYSIRRVFCEHEISEKELQLLFSGKTIGPFNMCSKAGKRFSAKLRLDGNKEIVFAN